MSSPSTKKRNKYILCDVDEVTSRVKIGETSQAKETREYGIPLRTLSRLCKKKKENVTAKVPGPAPDLVVEAEEDLVNQALAIQKQGLPVGWYMII